MSLPRNVLPAKKSTRTTAPSLSAAVAVMLIVAGAVNVVPCEGLPIDTDGAAFGGGAGALTVTVIAADVVTAPSSSVARAVTEYVPAGTPPQRNE